jgi:hypothetical protein
MVLIAARSLGPFILWIGIMIAGLAAVAVVLMMVRARLLAKDAGVAPGGMLDGLRRMRERGEISQEEFDAAKATMVARLASRGGSAGPKSIERSKPVIPRGVSGTMVAPPGYDLAGQPLPKAGDEGPAR